VRGVTKSYRQEIKLIEVNGKMIQKQVSLCTTGKHPGESAKSHLFMKTLGKLLQNALSMAH